MPAGRTLLQDRPAAVKEIGHQTRERPSAGRTRTRRRWRADSSGDGGGSSTRPAAAASSVTTSSDGHHTARLRAGRRSNSVPVRSSLFKGSITVARKASTTGAGTASATIHAIALAARCLWPGRPRLAARPSPTHRSSTGPRAAGHREASRLAVSSAVRGVKFVQDDASVAKLFGNRKCGVLLSRCVEDDDPIRCPDRHTVVKSGREAIPPRRPSMSKPFDNDVPGQSSRAVP